MFLLQTEYEEKIQMVKNGARNCLTKMETEDLPSPPSVLVCILHFIAVC